jgi:sarcosine oxidase subunit gamma
VSEVNHSSVERAPSEGEAAVTLAEVPLTLAWNVRGDPAQPAFVAEAGRLLGLPLPLQPNTSARGGGTALLWLGPKSWLFVAGRSVARNEFDDTRKALNGAGAALFDVSASYVAWSVSGAAAACVLNRGCPLDLHPSAFPAGHCAQSMLGHITALFYRPDESPAFIVMVTRSFANDAWRDLRASAANGDGNGLASGAALQLPW